MDLTDFANMLITNLISDPEMVKVKEFETEEGKILEILVSEEDMARIIGKHGKMANSIKSIIQAKAYQDGIKNVKINIDSF